jgi:hypothetical protein
MHNKCSYAEIGIIFFKNFTFSPTAENTQDKTFFVYIYIAHIQVK